MHYLWKTKVMHAKQNILSLNTRVSSTCHEKTHDIHPKLVSMCTAQHFAVGSKELSCWSRIMFRIESLD